MTHDSVDPILQLRGIFNRVRTKNSGRVNEINGIYNIAEYQKTGPENMRLLSASENEVQIKDTAGTGVIEGVIGVRAIITQENEGIVPKTVWGGVIELKLRRV